MVYTNFTIQNERATRNIFTQLHAFLLDEIVASGTSGLNLRIFHYFFETAFSIYIYIYAYIYIFHCSSACFIIYIFIFIYLQGDSKRWTQFRGSIFQN